jgi:hypothetical protein
LESQNEKYKNKFYTSENDSFGVKTAHVNFWPIISNYFTNPSSKICKAYNHINKHELMYNSKVQAADSVQQQESLIV